MKFGFLHAKKFRYGSVSLSLTVVIIAAVILLNTIFTALTKKNLWYIDMTPEPLFTLSDDAQNVLNQMNSERDVTVIFCDNQDVWESNNTQHEVLKTALDIQKEYRNVSVEYVDVFTNPSAVNVYKERTGKNINKQSVIVKSGEEVRVFSLSDFFNYATTTSSSTPTMTGYNGEQVLVSAMLAVTQSEAPMLCIVNNHGETDALTSDPGLLTLLSQTGFLLQPLDLSKEQIPDDCRMLLIFNPQSDYLEKSAVNEVSEIDKLEKFLSEDHSMMVFFNPTTPSLPNLEQFLSEWGVQIARDGTSPYLVQDSDHSLTSNGYTNVGTYSVGGTGADITEQLRAENFPKSVIFPNTGALNFSSLYKERQTDGYRFAYYQNGGISRECYTVFTSSADAIALANGGTVATASDDMPFAYMTLSCQTMNHAEENRMSHSFILTCASTQFVTTQALDSKYGNHAVLAYASNSMGSLVIPVSLDCKYFANTEISTITAKEANQYTVVLAVVPSLVIFVSGIFVMVRRKYA